MTFLKIPTSKIFNNPPSFKSDMNEHHDTTSLRANITYLHYPVLGCGGARGPQSCSHVVCDVVLRQKGGGGGVSTFTLLSSLACHFTGHPQFDHFLQLSIADLQERSPVRVCVFVCVCVSVCEYVVPEVQAARALSVSW